ncbi:hypothetical protein K7G98_35615, partial [Saccharothrix sp. MB29]|nr:hypothetical protein [Saccharothrix sp. MB29]
YCTAQFIQLDVWCILYDNELTADFPGGTISVDVDLLGFHDNAQYTWTVKSNFGNFCSATYYAADPARSWNCYNVPAGRIDLQVAKAGWHDASIGVRW